MCWEVDLRADEVERFLADVRAKNPGVLVQVFGAGVQPNPAAIELMAAQTLSAQKVGANLAERPELDLLLRIAGTRQIGEALRRAGYKAGAKRLFMVAAAEGEDPRLARMAEVLRKDARVSELKRRPPSEEDLRGVERAALLAARV